MFTQSINRTALCKTRSSIKDKTVVITAQSSQLVASVVKQTRLTTGACIISNGIKVIDNDLFN
jgi:hypothetical protein